MRAEAEGHNPKILGLFVTPLAYIFYGTGHVVLFKSENCDCLGTLADGAGTKKMDQENCGAQGLIICHNCFW